MNFNSLRSKVVRTVSPALCVGMLLGAAQLQRDWPSSSAAEGFHDRARAAIETIPLAVDGWTGHFVEPPPAAIETSPPNASQTIEYLANTPSATSADDDHVWLSVIECRRAADLLGHFPPKCYPAYGDSLLESRPRDWTIAPSATATTTRPTMIRGVEYRFERVSAGKACRRTVYNFLIAPRRGTVSDMKELTEAAEDYRRRYFGAAQVQVVFTSMAGRELDQATRDAVFATLVRGAWPAIEMLKRGD